MLDNKLNYLESILWEIICYLLSFVVIKLNVNKDKLNLYVFLMLIMAVIFAVTLAVAVFADSVHNENTVDYSATVTLNDGTVCPLYDSDKNALIWYYKVNI